MRYKPNPLLYGANRDFISSFKLAITMRSEIDYGALVRAVNKAMARYPYFCVYPEKEDNSIWLRHNPMPVPVFEGDRCAVLGSEECDGHLLSFACEGRRIFLNASHYIADGMGIDPLLKTVLYLYVSEVYGTEGLESEKIQMPSAPVLKEEYEYPFPERPIEIDTALMPTQTRTCAYALDSAEFDGDGLYAYHLHIPQKEMMKMANPSDGSPVSFLSVMLYRALCLIDSELSQPVVVHVQHQYRAALRAPLTRHSMVSYIPVALTPRVKDKNVLAQNTIVRGQILLGSEASADINAVNHLVSAFPTGDGITLEAKKESMRKYAEESIYPKTFGISYVGKMDWCGLDRYVEDIHAYIGEKNTKNMLLIEVMTIGEDFTLNFMQSGRGDRYVNAFVEQLRSFGIPVKMIGGARYTLCDTEINL